MEEKSPMLKLFLMTKNEFELLEDWLKYHGHLFGLGNIHVLDGSDDDRVFAIYERYRAKGLNVHHSSTGLDGLHEELTRSMHAHKGTNSFLIKLDTDEFLAYVRDFASGPLHGVLSSGYLRRGIFRRLATAIVDLKHGGAPLCVDEFRQFFGGLPVTGQRYKASLTAWSIPRVHAVRDVCRDLTEFTPLQFTAIKTFFHSDSFVSVDLGSHEGVSARNEGVIDTGLTLIHYHSTSVEDSARRARQVLQSHGYIDPGDSLAEQRRRLAGVRSRGRVNSFHKIDLYLRYLEALAGGAPVNPAALNEYNPYFRKTGAAREITLVRDTLNAIDGPGTPVP